MVGPSRKNGECVERPEEPGKMTVLGIAMISHLVYEGLKPMTPAC